MIKRNYFKIVRVFPDPGSYFYIKNETMSEGEIGFNSSWINTLNLEYSFDKVNWKRVDESIWYFDIPADGYLYLRNTSNTFCTSEYSQVFYPHNNISLGGDIRTLFNYTDVDSVTKIPDYGFNYPFSMQGDAKITDISNLSFRGITEIGNNGLYNAFSYSYIGTKGVDLRDVTTLGSSALYNIYYDNNNLTEVYAPNVSSWDTSKVGNWLYGVAPTGVVYKPANLTIPDYYGGIPEGWTTQDYPEE